MRCNHDHSSETCPVCTENPEKAARRTATASGFTGSVLGAVGGPVGAGIGGLVCGTAGYVAGYTAATARKKRTSGTGDPIPVRPERDADSDEHDEAADGDDHGEEREDNASAG